VRQRVFPCRVSFPAPLRSFYPSFTPTHKHGPVHANPCPFRVGDPLIYTSSVSRPTYEKQGRYTLQDESFHISFSAPFRAELYHSTLKNQREGDTISHTLLRRDVHDSACLPCSQHEAGKVVDEMRIQFRRPHKLTPWRAATYGREKSRQSTSRVPMMANVIEWSKNI
jgi:hypothetical protein